MDLHKELIQLLERAKATDEYFNPHLLSDILTAIENTHFSDDNIIPDELNKWAQDMWSR